MLTFDRRKLFIVLLGCLFIINVSAQEHADFFNRADHFFHQYVVNGEVNYSELKTNRTELEDLIQYLHKDGTLEVSSEADKALLINAYNLFVIKGVIDNYPIHSPLKVSGFFDGKNYQLAGKNVSLNQIEKEILIKQTGDPRLHFVLVCAANGCPKLAEYAYKPQGLNDLLDERTQLALNDPEFIRVDTEEKRVGISQIFDWYKSDFTSEGNTLKGYINQYRKEKLGDDFKVTFYQYDWELNEFIKLKGELNIEDLPDQRNSNLLKFTPSKLLAKRQYEVNFFSNLYSQTGFRDATGNEVSTGIRSSILTTMLQFTYGIADNARINVGADLILSAGSVGSSQSSSHFQLFGTDVNARNVAVTSIGPRIKFQPIKKYSFYSIQSSFLFPVANDPEALADRSVFLALNRYLWNTQFFYDFKLSNRFRLFYEFDTKYYIRRDKNEVFFTPNFVDLPSSAFVNYYPNRRVNLFVMGQYSPRYGRTALQEEDPDGKFGLLQWYIQLGGGLKYQVTKYISLELSYGNFVASRGIQGLEAGAGEVTNFAIRFIR